MRCSAMAIVLGAGLLLAPAAWAVNPVGSFTYQEPGHAGSLTIKRMDAGYVFRFHTSSTADPGQGCTFQTLETSIDEGGGRTDPNLPAVGGTRADGVRFTIAFDNATATVQVQAQGEGCTPSGQFGGVYVKTGK